MDQISNVDRGMRTRLKSAIRNAGVPTISPPHGAPDSDWAIYLPASEVDKLLVGETTIVLLSGGITEYPIPAGSPAVGNGLIGITAGPDGNVYFTDTLNNAIGQITPSGVITELPLPSSNDGSLVKNGLDGITLGAKTSWCSRRRPAGDLFIADTNNNVIREVSAATGDITTIAGSGKAGYSGDGAPRPTPS